MSLIGPQAPGKKRKQELVIENGKKKKKEQYCTILRVSRIVCMVACGFYYLVGNAINTCHGKRLKTLKIN